MRPYILNLKLLLAFSAFLTSQAVVFAQSRPVITLTEARAVSNDRPVDWISPNLRDEQLVVKVKVFPHDQDYAPHGKDLVRNRLSIVSSEPCSLYSVPAPSDLLDGKKALPRFLAKTRKIEFSASRLRSSILVRCPEAYQVVRLKMPENQNFFYRNDLVISKRISDDGKVELQAVNIASMRDYLRGVVPSEVSPSWPSESLKTQAVAARSYALFHRAYGQKYFGREGYHVDDTIAYQAYTGISHADPRTDAAVEETDGIVITFGDELVQAFFHADSGGATEDAEAVFGLALPYSAAVKEVVAYKSYTSTWKRTFSTQEINKQLKSQGLLPEGLEITHLSTGTPSSKKFPSGRVRIVVARLSDNSSMELDGSQLRRLLGLPSLKYTVTTRHETLHIEGQGRGHGVGLNQMGALFLSKEQDWDYQRILKFYYPKTELCRLSQEDVLEPCTET